MAHAIMDHGASWCFGTSLAPTSIHKHVRDSSLRGEE